MSRDESAVENDRPEIYYVPGAWNHYKYNDDVVVLDSRLKDYPKAHENIKQHELGHSDARSTIDLLVHEFTSDLHLYCSTDETAQELREYLNEEHSGIEEGPLRRIGHTLVDYLRPLWSGIMSIVGPVYRWCRS